MKQSILVATVYIIVFVLELLAYHISKSGLIFIYGIVSLIAFIITFGVTLADRDY